MPRDRSAGTPWTRPGRLLYLLRQLSAVALRMDFGGIRRRLQSEVRAMREARLVATSGLFDTHYYLAQAPGARRYPGGPLMHYLERGWAEGLRPNPLFDSAWYLQQNPDVASAGAQPLVHFIRAGSREGRDPNPYFDVRLYTLAMQDVPGMRASDGVALRHYLERGADLPMDPSSRFDRTWYLQHNPDAAPSGLPPLVHFLAVGKARGASPNRHEHAHTAGRPLPDVPLRCVKRFDESATPQEIALLALTTGTPIALTQAEALVRQLSRRGMQVVVIGAKPAFGTGSTVDALTAAADGLYEQPEASTSFKAWAHLVRRLPVVTEAHRLHWIDERLLALSDHPDRLDRALGAMRDPASPVATLAYSSQHGASLPWSGWISLSEEALRCQALHAFVQRIADLPVGPKSVGLQKADFVRSLQAADLAWSAPVMLDGPEDPLSAWMSRVEALPLAPAHAATPQPPTPAPHSPATRLLFIGPWNYNNGLGVASRSYLAALRRTPFDLHLEPVARPFHVHRRIAPAVPIRDFVGPADVAVLHLNPDSLTSMTTPEQRLGIDAAGLRIGLWVWETEQVPAAWLPALDQVDALWVPSAFCKDVFARHTDLPIDVVPHVVAEPAIRPSALDIGRTKREIGVEPGERVILYAFDGASYLVRKNPFALVRAFGRTGLAARGWRLVLKTKNLFDSREAGQRLQVLASACKGCVLIDRSLDRQAMRSLMTMADVYASPHCAEGFGLTVAEAMVEGKLVVATDYSGTRDFLDAAKGLPVRYDRITLDEDHGPYLRGDTWATIDEDHLAERLAEAAALVEAGDTRLGDAARRHILDALSAARVAQRMQQSISSLMRRPHHG